MDTNYFNRRSIPNSWASKSLTKKGLRDGLYMSIHRRMTTTHISEGVFIKMSLKNYDSLVDLSEHVQNMRGSLKLVLQVNDSMCKILPSTFQKSTHALYNNLEPISIQGFNDFCTKLVARFNTNIPIKKSSTKLFDVAQQEGESTWMYLNRFNEKMIKVEELLESIALEALIRGAREHVTWIKLYAFTNKSLLKVNQVMKNHKWMEEANLV